MNIFSGFPELPKPGETAVCFVNGSYCLAPDDLANVSVFTNSLDKHPSIRVSRDHIHVRNEAIPVYVEVEDNLLKRLSSVWHKHGWMQALQLATDQRTSRECPQLASVARSLLKIINAASNLRYLIQPHLKGIGPVTVGKYSQTRDWSNALVKCIAWHPHTTKIAVGAFDDSVRLYSSDAPTAAPFKCASQRNISSVAWRPLSASELAVGCEAGVVIWTVDPNTTLVKPSARNWYLLSRSGHSPVTHASWSPNGDVLASASAADASLLLWHVETRAAAPLRRVAGGGVAFLRWSPDAGMLFAASSAYVFRVWESVQWTAERWATRDGRVVAATWTPARTLLFALDNDSRIYALFFNDFNLLSSGLSGHKNASQKTVVMGDLAETEQGAGGAVQELACCPAGRHLAVTFRHCELVAVFTLQPSGVSLQLAPCCLVRGQEAELPSTIAWQQNFSDGACLAIAWSSGRIQYFPIIYSDQI